MLTDEEKSRIRQEETYRFHVRSQFEQAKERKHYSSWQILNSSFFLWFLSTIVLGTLTFTFTRWEADKMIQRERQQRIAQIDLEIRNRLQYFHMLKNIPDKIPLAIKILEKPSAAEYPINVYPEFINRSFRSLLIELNDLVGRAEQIELTKAINSASFLMYLHVQYEDEYKEELDLETKYELKEKLFRLLDESYNIDRWGRPFGNIIKKEIRDIPYERAFEELRTRFGVKDSIISSK
jgi:hypothetical protein